VSLEYVWIQFLESGILGFLYVVIMDYVFSIKHVVILILLIIISMYNFAGYDSFRI